MTLLTEAAEADRALKAKRRAIWASGDYEAVARRSSRRGGQSWSGAAAVKPSDRVLDVPAGTGNASIPATEAGAYVVASTSPLSSAASRVDLDNLAIRPLRGRSP